MTATASARPFTVPDQTLTDHTGRAFELRAQTRGRFALLFFGYTYCPDICPIQMATAHAALERLTEAERARVLTLFVSMDPRRDTVERLATWLAAMRSPAVGLRAPTVELDAILGDMGFVMPPLTSRQLLPGGGPDDYLVPHPAALFLITPDGLGRFQYGYERGTPDEIAADLRILMELDWSGPSAPSGGAPVVEPVRGPESPPPADADGHSRESGDASSASSLVVHSARIAANPTGERAAVYAEIENRRPTADTLVALRSELAAAASLHRMEERDGIMTMVPTSGIPVPARGTVELRPGGLHGMLEDLRHGPEPGDRVVVTFVFTSGAELTMEVPTVALSEMVPRH
jgi:protein SCO1/2